MKEVMVHIYRKITDFLTILSLMLSCYFQEKQRSFTSSDFWVLPRWQVTHFQFLSVFQDGGHVKFPTLGQRLNVKIPTQGKACSVNFPWVARPPPPWGLTLIGALCGSSKFLRGSCTQSMLSHGNIIEHRKILMTKGE